MELRKSNNSQMKNLNSKNSRRKGLFENDEAMAESTAIEDTINELEKLRKSSSTKTSKSESIHKDHRQRLKTQFLEHGIDSLTDIQKLELLLFYAIPQKDTNPTAHELINEVGSLKDVLTADVNVLTNVKGIKENSAILISLIGNMFNSISKPEESEYVGTTSKAKNFCKRLFVGVEVEQFYVICLSKSNRVKKYKLIQTGTADEVSIQIRSITEFAMATKCNRIIVTHNHPAGIGMMSDEDCKFTYSLICSCLLNTIELVDHIIVGTDKVVSMNSQKVLDSLKKKAFDRLQLPEEKRTYLSSLSDDYIVDDE